MTQEEKLQKIIDTASNDEVKSMAQAELQKLELIKKASGGDDLARALVALKDVVDGYKSSSKGSSGASV